MMINITTGAPMADVTAFNGISSMRELQSLKSPVMPPMSIRGIKSL